MPANNERIWRIVKVILAGGIIIVSIAVAYGALNQKVSNHSSQLDVHERKIETTQKAVVRIESDMAYIKKGIDEIKVELRNDNR